MRKLLIAMLALLLVATAARAQENCETEEADVDTGETPAGRYYVVNDECQPGCLFSVWIYQESNGVDGLQRGDDVCLDDGSCCGHPESDTVIF
jgi:hypothetical protein